MPDTPNLKLCHTHTRHIFVYRTRAQLSFLPTCPVAWTDTMVNTTHSSLLLLFYSTRRGILTLFFLFLSGPLPLQPLHTLTLFACSRGDSLKFCSKQTNPKQECLSTAKSASSRFEKHTHSLWRCNTCFMSDMESDPHTNICVSKLDNSHVWLCFQKSYTELSHSSMPTTLNGA